MKAALSDGSPNRHPMWASALAALLALTGCVTMEPRAGAAKTDVTGAAGGATAEGASSTLEHCDEALGALAVVEDQSASWYQSLALYRLGSTIPVLRLLIQQSNCFVIVERGLAMQNMNTERALQQTGEMRTDGNFGKGQMVAADYTMSPTITFNQNTGGAGGALGGLVKKRSALGLLMGSVKTNEASTMLIMIDNRSGVQLAAAEGSAKRSDLDFGAALLGPMGAAGATSYSKSPAGKIIISAFTDSYNQLVRAVRNYKAQTVQGGLGAGGTMGVQGGSTAASAEVDAAAVAKPVAAK